MQVLALLDNSSMHVWIQVSLPIGTLIGLFFYVCNTQFIDMEAKISTSSVANKH